MVAVELGCEKVCSALGRPFILLCIQMGIKMTSENSILVLPNYATGQETERMPQIALACSRSRLMNEKCCSLVLYKMLQKY